ncbi:caspase-3 [Chanos chanos]|uniref:Caspase-3 n=1 Tax=Chanos chanos TaxID=29144 RepID=A0A6J2UY53_CHACN|nr:caspase-3-like [Chanos chanos]
MSFPQQTLWGQSKAGNRVLIVSVSEFHPGVDLSKRKGVRRDNKRLHRIFCRLGFSVEMKIDLTADEIYEAFKEESQRRVSSCFVGVVSSHGEEGLVFGADGRPVSLAKIFSWFGGPSMAGKTKLFFIQACRGQELDSGVETDSAAPCEEQALSELFSIPTDTAVMYAAAPGYAAFHNPVGSVFLQTLCDLLEEEGSVELEVHRLLTRLNSRVAYHFQARGEGLNGKKAMPCIVSRLTTELFPFMDPRKTETDPSLGLALDLSATRLVSKAYKPRKNSIS